MFLVMILYEFKWPDCMAIWLRVYKFTPGDASYTKHVFIYYVTVEIILKILSFQNIFKELDI